MPGPLSTGMSTSSKMQSGSGPASRDFRPSSPLYPVWILCPADSKSAREHSTVSESSSTMRTFAIFATPLPEHASRFPCLADRTVQVGIRGRWRARRTLVRQNASGVSAGCRAFLVLSSDDTAVRAFGRQVAGRSRAARCTSRVNAGLVHPMLSEQDEARDPIARSRELTRILRKREIPMGEIIDKTKGKIKQVAGTLTGKDKLKADGKLDELKGRAKGAVEDIKHAAKGAAK